MVLVLSHGQSDVERGLSVNKDVVSYYMGGDTLCAYRPVYDGINKMGCEIHEVVIKESFSFKTCMPGTVKCMPTVAY